MRRDWAFKMLLTAFCLWASGARAVTWYPLCDDNFNRPNTSPAATPGAIGNNWVDRSGSIYQIVNNQLAVNGANVTNTNYGIAARPASESSLNQRIQLTTRALVDEMEDYTLTLRLQSSGDCYRCTMDMRAFNGSLGSAAFGIKKTIGGTTTNLNVTGSYTVSFGHYYLLDANIVKGASASSATITFAVSDLGTSLPGAPVGTVTISYTDNAVPASVQGAGQYGVITSHYDGGAGVGLGNSAIARVVTYTDSLTAPVAFSAATPAAGTSVTVNFSVPGMPPLTFGGSGTAAGAAGFTVNVAGNPLAVSSVSASGSVVTLALGGTVLTGQAVTVSYAAGGAGTLQDSGGTAVASFSGLSAANSSLVAPNATGYTAVAAPSATTVGVPLTLTLTLTGGTALVGNLQVTPTLGPGLSGAFSSGTLACSGGVVTIPNGVSTGTFVFTPSAPSGTGNTVSFSHSSGGFTGGDPASLSVTVTVGPAVYAANSPAIFWSPAAVSFDGGGNAWLTENGVYFKAVFTGASLKLNVDLSIYKSNGIPQSGWGQWIVHLDGGAATLVSVADPGGNLTVQQVPLASGLAVGSHTVEAWFNLQDETDTYTPRDALIVDSIQLDAGGTLTAPTASTPNIALRPRRALILGDSITKGYKATDPGGIGTASGNLQYALSTYAQILLRGLNAEGGIVGKSGQGWTQTYNAWTGLFPNVWANAISGRPRTFPPLDYLIVAEGTNDINPITPAVRAWLPTARAAVGAACWILLLAPFNGTHLSELTGAVAGYQGASGDGRVAVINLADAVPVSAGFNTVDGTHPQDVTHAWYAAAAAGKIIAATMATSAAVRRILH